MMLPLIIVPAIAMLKPADQKGSLLSSLLSAASSDEVADELPDADGFQSNAFSMDEFGSKPGFQSELTATDDLSELENALFAEAADGLSGAGSSASPQKNLGPGNPGVALSFAGNSSTDGNDADTEHLLGLLRQLGVSRTIWFSPGNDQSIGFVAFFQPGQGIITYRFEAIAASRAAAATDVLMQVKSWLATPQR